MLQLTDITLRVAGRPLLEQASARIGAGERVGLVGPNGTGKTTLLKLIANEFGPDEGEVAIPARWRIGRVKQEAPSGPMPLLEVVLAADAERSQLLAEADQTDDAHRLAEIHARLDDIGAAAAPARAARILAGLGFPADRQMRPASELSGGWRMRVALAGLLFAQPDLLLLDEPTNHLDLEATLWLEDYLRSYPGTLLIVSHDRSLLNGVAQRIVHLEARKLVSYKGNYDTFERTRSERQMLQTALRERQIAERKHIQSFIDRFRYKASKARQAQSRIKALAKMEPIAAVIEDHQTRFSFPEVDELSPPLLALDRLTVGYEPGKPILRNLSLRLDPDDRIALLGANGNGKSTFLKLLAGRLKHEGGEQIRHPRLKVGYFAQDQAEELDLDATPLQHLERALPKAQVGRHRSHLARFGLDVNKAQTEVRKLSGGEKARLLFALVTLEDPQILLLDEPTNHLDIDARQALVQALADYAGAVILVSHDPHLVELVADRLWLVAENTVTPYEGDLGDYRTLVLSAGRGQLASDRVAKPVDRRAERKAASAANRAEEGKLRRAAETAEQRLTKLNAAKEILERRLGDPTLYQGPSRELKELQQKLKEITGALGQAEEQWLAAQSALEAMASGG